MNHEYQTLFTCTCSHRDHDMVLTREEEVDGPMLSIEVRLEYGSLRDRLVQAWRYVLGRSCGYLTIAEFVVRPSDVPRLRAALDELEKHE